jgi:capsular polysaccharide biosynthesis protein
LTSQNTPDNIEEQDLDLRVIIQLLKKHRALIALITLLSVLVSGIFSFFVLSPVYQAKTVLLVTQAADKLQVSNQRNDMEDLVSSAYRMPVLTMNTYVGQVKSEALMKRVIEKMGLEQYGYTPRGLAGQVNATAAKDSYLLDITVNNTDPRLAVDIANTISQEFMDSITERNQEVMDRSVEFLQEQMELVKAELADNPPQSERERLQGMLTLLSEGITKTQIARSFDLGSTSLVVVSPALRAAQIKPNKQMNMAIAFLLGLMGSVGLVFLLEFLDNTIKTPEDVARHLELPVMGIIPSADSRAGAYYGSYYKNEV